MSSPSTTIAPIFSMTPGAETMLLGVAQNGDTSKEALRAYQLRLMAVRLGLVAGFDDLLSLDAIDFQPFDYQVRAARTALRRFRGRGLLSDEVGLEKTIEAGLVFKEYLLRQMVGRVLILTPPGLVEQWREELVTKFKITDFVTNNDEPFRALGPEAWLRFPYVIASLATARRPEHRQVITSEIYDLVIVDEAHHLKECVVCHRPVCRQSLITCPACKRGTCREHQTLCHAADGQPAVLPEEAPPVPPKTAEKSPSPAPASTSPRADKDRSPTPKGAAAKGSSAKSAAAKKPPPTPTAKGVRINIEIHETEPLVVAFVMRSTNRVLATRSFELTPKGILVTCTCEKQPCPATGYYHRPHPAVAIGNQMEAMLKDLQREYLVPTKKVDYFHRRNFEVWESNVLILPAFWRDPETLEQAVNGFDDMARRRY